MRIRTQKNNIRKRMLAGKTVTRKTKTISGYACEISPTGDKTEMFIASDGTVETVKTKVK